MLKQLRAPAAAILRRFRRPADAHAWFDARVERVDGRATPRVVLYADYVDWVLSRGERPADLIGFVAVLRARGACAASRDRLGRILVSGVTLRRRRPFRPGLDLSPPRGRRGFARVGHATFLEPHRG